MVFSPSQIILAVDAAISAATPRCFSGLVFSRAGRPHTICLVSHSYVPVVVRLGKREVAFCTSADIGCRFHEHKVLSEIPGDALQGAAYNHKLSALQSAQKYTHSLG